MSFTDLATVKIALGIPVAVTKLDAVLTMAVDAANSEVLQYLCLDACAVTSYDVVADVQQGETMIRIGPRPLVTISAVTLWDQALTLGTSYTLDGSVVKLCSACGCRPPRWLGGDKCGSFTATVTAGFAVVPPNLILAVTALAIGYYTQLQNMGVESKKIRNYQIKYKSGGGQMSALGIGGAWPTSLTMALGPWMRVMHMRTATVRIA